MTNRQSEVLNQFEVEVARHQLAIIHDWGTHRHLRAARPGSSAYLFDIVTWPGHLAISGDMNSFVFARLPDMFEFFRPGDDGLRINPRYWAEKLQATATGRGHEEFSEDRLREALAYWAEGFEEEDFSTRAEMFQAAKAHFFGSGEDLRTVDDALRRAQTFEHDKARFDDLWDFRLTDYTHHYLWCCYAIVWAIKRYDEQCARAAA